MRLIALMAANDLRRRRRDRSALITAFLAPFALAAIISLALGAGGEGLEAKIGVVDADESALSRELAGGSLPPPPGAVARSRAPSASSPSLRRTPRFGISTPSGWERQS